MMLATPLLLLPTISLLPTGQAWLDFLNLASPTPSIDYTTCDTQATLDLLCPPSTLPPLPSTLDPSSHCCGDNSYHTYGSCVGQDNKNYSNVPLCQEPGSMVKIKKRQPACGDGCQLVITDGVTVEEVDTVMRENSSYCISYFCEDLTMEWKLNMELCKCSVEKEKTSTILESDELSDDLKSCQYKTTSKIRSCCGETQTWNGTQCSPTSDGFYLANLFPEAGAHLFMVEFSSWNSCPEGTKDTQLYPGHSCYDKGVLGEDGDLVFMDRGLTVVYGEFCVAKLERSFNKGEVFIQACMPHKKITAQSFYIYILGTSILCLVLTMVIYITSPELTSLTNQIMFHLTTALLIAYIALIFIQNPESLEAQLGQSRLLCQSLAYLEQFSFLAAFTWMTIMSMENMNQLNGCGQSNSLQQSKDEIKKLMMIGYGVPLMLSLGTAAVELFTPECAVYKPRFGHRSCFFYGELDKFLWFYLPIIVMLVINSFIFVYIVVNVCRYRVTNKGSGMADILTQKSVEEGVLYTRLFVGMGLNWYLEIVAWAMGAEMVETKWQVVPDCVNMLQGVWVFLNFICQRKVVRVIKKRQRSIIRSRLTRVA